MVPNDVDTLQSVIGKLDRLAKLTDADRSAIAALPFEVARVPANYYLAREGARTTHCTVLLEGYACRHKMTSEGNRQIVSFHMMGDILDFQHLLLARADHNLQTITACTIASVPFDALRELSLNYPKVGEALWRDTLIDSSISREWVLNVGRRDAKSRIAHMLCEFAVRREVAGLGAPERFELPMTQEQIADATGLTAVHVNRMLHALADDGVIERDRRAVSILDWGRMRAVADFDADYLHAAA